MKHLLAGLVLTLGVGLGPGAARACTDVIAAPPVIRYDFTQASAIVEPLLLTISDACEAAESNRRVEVWLRDRVENGAPYRMLGGLPLEVRQAAVNVVQGPNDRETRFARINYAPNAPATAQLDVRLPGGQPGAVSETRQYDLVWRYTDSHGQAQVASRPITFSLVVTPAFEAVIAGGGKTHTMDFGVLSAGATNVVNLRFRATDPFEVTMTSQYGGVMRRVDVCGAAAAEPQRDQNGIRYAATLDGRPITLNSRYTNISPRGGAVSTFDNVPFQVQIDPTLDPATKLAGRYCDVITLRIGQKI